MPIKTIPIRLKEAVMLSEHVKHFTFELPENSDFSFIPGQFITMHFEHQGRTIRRSYSLANREHKTNALEFAAGYVKNGLASEKLFQLSPGDTIHISGPVGRLILKETPATRYIFVATSTGITPYRSMLNTFSQLLKQTPSINIVILQGVQQANHLLYADEFRDFASMHTNMQFYACYSREKSGQLSTPDERAGYVQETLAELEPTATSDIIYLCGNPNMIDSCYHSLKEAGFDNKHIVREKYISSK